MNVATLKSILFLVALALFGGLVYYAYDFKREQKALGSKRPYWDEAYATSVLDNVARPETPKARIVDYKAVVSPAFLTLDWTGSPPSKVVEVAPTTTGPVEKPKVVVKDLLSIQMVRVSNSDPGESSAIVVWKAPALKNANRTLKIGRVLPSPFDSAVVKDIRPEGIEFVFTRDGQDNELVKVPSGADGLIVTVDGMDKIIRPVPRRTIQPLVATGNIWPDKTRLLAPDMFEVGSAELDEFGRDYARILTEDVRLETNLDKNGKRSGLKIVEVKAGSLASSHGARTGDVIISINGESVSSEQQAISFVRRNSENTTTWQVVVENLGQQRTVTYNTPQPR